MSTTATPAVLAPAEILADEVDLGPRTVPVTALPRGTRLDDECGIVRAEALEAAMLYRNPYAGLYETRIEALTNGDLLLLWPDAVPGVANGHYVALPRLVKHNVMRGLRSRDRGRTWSAPFIPFDQPFSQHAFVPLIPRGSHRLYAFGTQPNFTESEYLTHGTENAPIGWRASDDHGATWSDIRYIRPSNEPGYQGMAVNRMAETPGGAWVIASSRHRRHADPSQNHTTCHIHILRSGDRGQTWEVLPGPQGTGWRDAAENLSEPSIVTLADGTQYLQARSTTGVLWEMRSRDEGRTWSDPRPTPLVHAWSPSALFTAEGGRLVASLHHNVARGTWFDSHAMRARGQLWVSLSRDGARTWEAPRYLCSSALTANTGNPWKDWNCSYPDATVLDGEVHLVIPHRWQRVVYLRLPLAALEHLPTAARLGS